MNSARRSHRTDPSRLKLGSGLESLESRVVLSTTRPFSPWIPSDLPVYTAVTHEKLPVSIDPLVQQALHNPQAQFLNSRGKVVSGKDRQMNEWTITVHGPGTVLVTDTTPNDGMLDDDIATIQLIGTDPNRTYVTGQTTASAFTPTDGTVLFNKLISTTGVKSVVLNGFTLTQTVDQPVGTLQNSDTGIFLTGGVGLLQFHDILATTDTAFESSPINIVIGDPSTPLRVAPTIRLDSIYNTVFDSNASTVPVDPQTTPTVNIVVNGELHGLEFISSTQHPYVDPAQALRGILTFPGFIVGQPTQRYVNPTLSPIANAGVQSNFPIVGTTGRTAVRANGIGQLHTRGNATNVTVSRGAVPFQNGFSGVNHIRRASFGGNADAVGLDVRGRIGSLTFKKGLGSPVGDSTAATQLGIPSGRTGFPAAGLQGGLVTANQIGRLNVGPANSVLQHASNPDFVQLRRQGYITYFARPGNALTSSTIASAGSIGNTNVLGTTVNSEIKSGFDYPSYTAGLEGTRSPSRIGRMHVNGDMVNGVVSSTFRPGVNNVYGNSPRVAGPGRIFGNSNSTLYVTGGVTPLNNQGAGYFARSRSGGYLPPPAIHRKVSSAQVP